jgi:hypothetical protein
MATSDLDELHKARIKQLEKVRPRKKDLPALVFLGESIARDAFKPKLILSGFSLDQILPILPFTPILYVRICPRCVASETTFEEYAALLRNRLITPVLMAPYKYYPQRILDGLKSIDHVSSYEAFQFRAHRLWDQHDVVLCAHCFGERRKTILSHANELNDEKHYLRLINSAFACLAPAIFPDFELADEIERATKEKDLQGLDRLHHVSQLIHKIRTAQTWNGALPINAADLALLPDNVSSDVEEGRRISISLRNYAADGLGIKIPRDIPIDRYAEIVRENQPRITAVVDRVVSKAGHKAPGFDALCREISRMNNEIERIKGLKRYLLLEAIAEPVRKNKALVASALVTAALGLGGSLGACIGTGVAGGAVHFGKKTKLGAAISAKFANNVSLNKFGRKLHGDLIQPSLERVLSIYLQARLPAVSVLAIQQDLENVSAN